MAPTEQQQSGASQAAFAPAAPVSRDSSVDSTVSLSSAASGVVVPLPLPPSPTAVAAAERQRGRTRPAPLFPPGGATAGRGAAPPAPAAAPAATAAAAAAADDSTDGGEAPAGSTMVAGGDVMEVPSLCMMCEGRGVTRLLLTRIPYFRDVIIMSFSCNEAECGYRSTEVQAAEMQEKGCAFTVTVAEPKVRVRGVLGWRLLLPVA